MARIFVALDERAGDVEKAGDFQAPDSQGGQGFAAAADKPNRAMDLLLEDNRVLDPLSKAVVANDVPTVWKAKDVVRVVKLAIDHALDLIASEARDLQADVVVDDACLCYGIGRSGSRGGLLVFIALLALPVLLSLLSLLPLLAWGHGCRFWPGQIVS